MEEEKKTDWFNLVASISDKLTAKRIFAAFITGLLLTFITVAYENRDAIFQRVYYLFSKEKQAPSNWLVSAKTEDELTGFIQKSKIVKFALITEVDLQKNRRTPRFWYLRDVAEKAIREKTKTMLPLAVFDYDPKNTQQMVAVLNNEFVCSRFQDTVYSRLFPEFANRMPIICRLAIPPFYGRFVGILTIGLEVPPSKEELDSIRIEVARLAVDIYLRDVIKKPVP